MNYGWLKKAFSLVLKMPYAWWFLRVLNRIRSTKSSFFDLSFFRCLQVGVLHLVKINRESNHLLNYSIRWVLWFSFAKLIIFMEESCGFKKPECQYKNHFVQRLDILSFSLIMIHMYSLRKSNNYSLKSAQHKSVIILWEEDDTKQLYLVLKVSCRRTDNLSARYNDHQKIYSIMASLTDVIYVWFTFIVFKV